MAQDGPRFALLVVFAQPGAEDGHRAEMPILMHLVEHFLLLLLTFPHWNLRGSA